MKKNKRAQAPKGRNIGYMRGMQEIRKGNAAGPHRSESDYRRKGKYPTDLLDEAIDSSVDDILDLLDTNPWNN